MKNLFFKATDGTTYVVPESILNFTQPADGKDGNGIASAVLNADYTLTLTFTDGTKYTTPSLRGAPGVDGNNGKDGHTPVKGVDYFDGLPGKDGEDGKTPVKGVDYFTAADQEAIVQQVITALGTPVFGRVDAEKNIVLSGSLAEGNYTVKYEDATGNQTVIGSIAVGDALINMIPISTGADGTIYNEVGYKTNMRLSNSTGNEATHDGGFELTGFIPMTVNDVAYGNAGMFLGTKNSYLEICAYDSSKALLGHSVIYNNPVTYSVNDNGTWVYTPANDSAYANIAYIRVCADVIDENSIITINQPLS